MTKQSIGPWKADCHASYFDMLDGNGEVVLRIRGGMIPIPANAQLMAAAPEMLEALKAALYGMDELLRSYAITHVVRGQCKGQRPLNPDELSAADEAGAQYQQARAQIEAVIDKAEGSK